MATEFSLQCRGCCTSSLCSNAWTLVNIARAPAAALNQHKLYQEQRCMSSEAAHPIWAQTFDCDTVTLVTHQSFTFTHCAANLISIRLVSCLLPLQFLANARAKAGTGEAQPISLSDFCRSGRSLTLVTQYDVELFQKIEALTGHKMEEYPAEQEAVLLLLERVGEAQRISTMQVPAPPITSSYQPILLDPPYSSSL